MKDLLVMFIMGMLVGGVISTIMNAIKDKERRDKERRDD